VSGVSAEAVAEENEIIAMINIVVSAFVATFIGNILLVVSFDGRWWYYLL
jgi:hypothetical protein